MSRTMQRRRPYRSSDRRKMRLVEIVREVGTKSNLWKPFEAMENRALLQREFRRKRT